MTGDDPHGSLTIDMAGASKQAANAAVILLHGRGSNTETILRLADYHHGVLYLAPRAARNRWYPRSGYAPIEDNEPWFTSALGRVSESLTKAGAAGVPPERTLILGFSQGACLASEFVARHPRRYGGLVVLSGSLLGPEIKTDYQGSLDGTPVFFSCSEDDPYVSSERIHDSQQVFEALDGNVTTRLYSDLGHAINDDEIRRINVLVEQLQ